MKYQPEAELETEFHNDDEYWSIMANNSTYMSMAHRMVRNVEYCRRALSEKSMVLLIVIPSILVINVLSIR